MQNGMFCDPAPYVHIPQILTSIVDIGISFTLPNSSLTSKLLMLTVNANIKVSHIAAKRS